MLGVRLTHSRPGRPQGRGKVERLFRTIREGFLIEAARRRLESLAELERLLAAWLGQVYHRRTHSETGHSPASRYRCCEPRYPEPERLREAFLWRTERIVNATALVSLAGNRYEVAPELAGQKVELLYDPNDLTQIRVRRRGRDHGLAVPHRIARHVHQAAQDPQAPAPAPASGIDYLELVERAEEGDLRRRIAYRELDGEGSKRPGSEGER